MLFGISERKILMIGPDDISCDYDGLTVEVEYDGIKAATELAVLFNIGGDEYWVPKRLLAEVAEDTFLVADWFANKEGLI